MKILLLIDSLGSGGAQRQMITLAEMLHEQKHEISFLVYHKEDFFKDRLMELGIPVKYIIEHRPLWRLLKVRKTIRRGKYDVVISFLETPNILNCFSAIGGKKWKVITSERSANIGRFLSVRGKVLAWLQYFSDAIVCNSYNAKSIWVKHYPKYKDKLNVIYNLVILPDITSEYIPKRDGKLNIVVAASYQFLKNPIGLIRALTLMTELEQNQVKINWYGRVEITKGDTRAYDESVALISKYGLENSIFLNNPTKDIANIMNEADVVALFSEFEGQPNAICEAMMIGKPIIMTKVSDYQLLVNKDNGILCDWDKPESIRNALIEAIHWSSEEIKEKGIQSKKKAELLFSSSIIRNLWIEQIN